MTTFVGPQTNVTLVKINKQSSFDSSLMSFGISLIWIACSPCTLKHHFGDITSRIYIYNYVPTNTQLGLFVGQKMVDCLHHLISIKMRCADWSVILVWLTSRKHELHRQQVVVKIEVHLPEGFNVYYLISHDIWALLSNWHQ